MPDSPNSSPTTTTLYQGYGWREEFPADHEIATLEEFVELVNDAVPGEDWVYRGHPCFQNGLWPSVERICAELQSDSPLSILRSYETFTLSEFQRRAHHYHRNLPLPEATFEWLALMQHHGVPTRLLDFTFSPFVALFFALWKRDQDAAIWAINRRLLLQQAFEVLHDGGGNPPHKITSEPRKMSDYATSHLTKSSHVMPRAVLLAAPFMMNERLARQQGLFLFALGNSRFGDSLQAVIGKQRSKLIKKIKIVNHERVRFLRGLHQMNITPESLFPGLDYYASSLTVRFEVEQA